MSELWREAELRSGGEKVIKTHKLASKEWVGEAVEVKDGFAKVRLKTREEMKVDEYGLIHGGFTFGAADLAAMLAVNEETVVLYKAEVKFTAPVKVGEEIVATAKVVEVDGRKRKVEVEAWTDKKVLEGVMYCYVPEKHVLS